MKVGERRGGRETRWKKRGRHAWYLDDGTIIGDTLVVGKVGVNYEDGPRCGLHLNVDKTEIFWLKENPRSRLAGVFPPNISWRLHGAKLLVGPASVEFNFSSELVMKRVAKTFVLMDTIAKINDPQCELLLLRVCAGISKLYFDMRTCSPQVLEMAYHSFDAALHSTLERLVTASEPGVPLFSVLKPCSACSKVFTGDIYRDHAVSYTGIIGIKHLHNVMRDTLVDICFRSGISAGKEVDIGLGGGRGKPLRPADMLLYSWDERLDVCVDLTGSSPLTQTGMVDFVPGRAVIDAAHRKRFKYEAKCADIRYGFLPFFIFFAWIIREGCCDPTEADPKVLHDSRH
nr:hypothetical protein [Tanacetum cinerariifolium]